MNPTHVNPREDFFLERAVEISAVMTSMRSIDDLYIDLCMSIERLRR